MKKFLMIGLLLLPLSVVSQGEKNSLKLSAFVGEGMGTGFGIETNREKVLDYSISIGYGELIYNTYNNLNLGYSGLMQYSNFFQRRVSYLDTCSDDHCYIYEYSHMFHFSSSLYFTVLKNKFMRLQLSSGMQCRLYSGTDKVYYTSNQISVPMCPDPEYVGRNYHKINFGFLTTANVSFFYKNKFSPFISYGGFIDIIDATEFKWLHAFQIGVSYNWHRRVTE